MCESGLWPRPPLELGFGVGPELLRGLFSVPQHLGIEGPGTHAQHHFPRSAKGHGVGSCYAIAWHRAGLYAHLLLLCLAPVPPLPGRALLSKVSRLCWALAGRDAALHRASQAGPWAGKGPPPAQEET